MPNIDLRFIVLLVGVMGLLMSVIIFFLRRSLPSSIKGLREWAAAPAIVLVSMVLLAMRGAIPDFLSILGGNLLLLVGCLLFHVGTQRFFGVATEKSLRIWLTVLTLSVPAIAWCSLIEPDYAVRLRLMATLMFVIFVSLALMVHKQGGRTFAGRFTALVLFVQSVVILLRFIATFVWPSGTGLFEPFVYQTLYIASFTFTMLLLTVGTVLLTTERMRAEFEHVIDDAKQAEAALRESEGRFKNLFKDIPSVAVQGYMQDGTTSYWNQASELLYGYGREEAVGRNLLDLIIPVEMHSAVREAMHGMFETATPIPAGELSLMRKDGSRVDVFSSHAYVHVPGRPPEMFCLDIGITERKRTEAALKESEERWKFAIEGVGDGLWDWNVQTGEAYYSLRYKEMFGYTDADIGTTADEWSQRIHPDDAPQVFAALQPYMDGKPGSATVEFRMLCKDGSWQWTLGRGMVVSRDTDGKALRLIGTNTDITQRKAAEEAIKNLAFYDTLTGLPNRRLLLDRLKQAMAASTRSERHGALLFIDLDNFKTLNDTRGHDIGDLLLQQVAQRLTSCVRECDTVARLGGDEFVVMMEDLSEESQSAATQTETIGEKILATLNQTYQLGDHEYRNTPSIGVTLFTDRLGSIDELLKRADLAMYQAKAGGRNTMRFYDPQMQAAVTSRAALESGLREAMQKEQFRLYYQAQMNGNGQLTGSEVLLRWQHPERGMVSPADFIPLAEETRLILPLGHWVLQTACTQLALWGARPELAHLTVAVNVSAHQFHQAGFVDQVVTVLKDTGANPQRLKLELTESLLVSNVDEVIEKMFALRAEGVGFSLDDFGTGYSSLSYLKRLPLDQLKIDQSFVRDVLVDPSDASIAKTIIALAQNLGLGVIAEGVETEAQRCFLATSGCHAYQGFFFSRPLPLVDFEEFALRQV